MSKELATFITSLSNNGMESLEKFYSKYRGFVVDRDDPEKLQRLKLVIPQVSGNQVYNYWAFPTGVFSGEGYGSQVIPQKGDVVWVEFEGGCPEIPLWSHGHFARKEMPKGEEYTDPNSYWFKTPKGHFIIFNDTKNTIHIQSNLGDAVELNEKGISLISKRGISSGTLNKSKYHSLLGEEVEDLFKDFEKIVNDLHSNMLKDVAKFTSLGFVNTAKVLPLLTLTVAGLKAKIGKILSKLNTLD